MKTYKLVVQPDIRLVAHGLLSLTEDALMQEISDIVVRELSETHFGWRVVDVELRRQDDAEALDEIVAALERLGFSLVEVTVSKWASAMAGKVVGAVGGFAVGAGASENLAVGLVTSAIGTFIGHLVGDAARRIVADYKAQRDHRGIWVFGEMIPRQPSIPADLRLGTSPA
jgi:hypothetical protein